MGKISPASRCFVLKLVENGYSAKKIFDDFRQDNWRYGGIKSLVQKIRKTGGIQRTVGSGRPRIVRTPVNSRKVLKLAVSPPERPNTHLSTRKLADKTQVHRSSVMRILKGAGLKCYKRVPAQKLTDQTKKKRLIRSKILLQKLKTRPIDHIVFSDEKDFLVDSIPVNTQNSRIYSFENLKHNIPSASLVLERQKFSRKLMVWAGVSKMGKTKIIFLDPGTKVNKELYISVLKNAKLDFGKISPNGQYVFQQDGATSHTAKSTVKWMDDNLREYWKPSEWPPSSPDLNPLDYYVWKALQELVYQVEIRDLKHLKRRILWAWTKLDQNKISAAIDQFTQRLKLVISQKGGHIETRLL